MKLLLERAENSDHIVLYAKSGLANLIILHSLFLVHPLSVFFTLLKEYFNITTGCQTFFLVVHINTNQVTYSNYYRFFFSSYHFHKVFSTATKSYLTSIIFIYYQTEKKEFEHLYSLRIL